MAFHALYVFKCSILFMRYLCKVCCECCLILSIMFFSFDDFCSDPPFIFIVEALFFGLIVSDDVSILLRLTK